MLNKPDLSRLIEHLKKDKVLRTQTFLSTKKLTADSVVENDGGTLLHLACKLGAENVFWSIRRGARPAVYVAKDKHGRTPCHYAAINLIKTSKMSVFNNIIQPMIDESPDCLHVRDGDGRTPLQILSAHAVCANMLRAQLGAAPTAQRVPDSWQEKIWAEMQYENRRFNKYDRDFSECLSDEAEDMDSWSERIRSEHERSRAESPRHRPRHSPADQQRQRELEQEQERQRLFEEAERRRRAEEEERRRAREEAARRRLDKTPKRATAQLCKAVRRYRALHRLVHDEDGPLVPRDFGPLSALTLRDTRRLVEAGAVDAAERRRAVRDMLRLWHPDKCMSKIERRLNGDVGQVKTTVVSFVQLLNQLL